VANSIQGKRPERKKRPGRARALTESVPPVIAALVPFPVQDIAMTKQSGWTDGPIQ
jgi:hypothetical protein